MCRKIWARRQKIDSGFAPSRLTWNLAVILGGLLPGALTAQKVLTWDQIKQQFAGANPTLQAGAIGIQESRQQEVTAHLRQNPDVTANLDQFNPFKSYTGPSGANVYRPFANMLPFVSASYLLERQHKRDLRLESAQKATAIAVSQQSDLERNLLFSMRTAFVQMLQAKAALAVNRESLAYYDKVLEVSGERLKTGDIARVDLARLQLQRIQFLTDVQTAEYPGGVAPHCPGLTPLHTFKVNRELGFRTGWKVSEAVA